MKIKNYYINDVDTFLESLIKEIIKNNVSYALLKYEDFIELHYLNSICRFYFANNLEMAPNELNFEPFNDLYTALRTEKNKKRVAAHNYVDEEIVAGKVVCGNYSNERPGYKRYTKKNIRLDNKSSKTRTKIKR